MPDQVLKIPDHVVLWAGIDPVRLEILAGSIQREQLHRLASEVRPRLDMLAARVGPQRLFARSTYPNRRRLPTSFQVVLVWARAAHVWTDDQGTRRVAERGFCGMSSL